MRSDGEHPTAGGLDAPAATARRPGMQHERSARQGQVQAFDTVTLARLAWVPMRGHHDRKGGTARARRRDSRKVTASSGVHEEHPVPIIRRNEHGRLGIAEADVVLEHPRLAVVDHEADEEDPTKRRPFGRHSRQSRLHHLPHDSGSQRVPHDRRRRIGPHPSGVGPGVSVADALVVLRRRERDGSRPVAHDVEAGLLAGQALLDHHDASGVAKLPLSHHPVDRRAGLVHCVGHDDALACREPVGLHDERATRGPHVALGGVRVVEHRERRSRNPVPLAEVAS